MQYCFFELFVEHTSFILVLYKSAFSKLLLLFLLKLLYHWTKQYLLNHCWDSVSILKNKSANTCLIQILLHVSLLMQYINYKLFSVIYSLSVLISLMWSDLCHLQRQTLLFHHLNTQMLSVILIWRIEKELKREKSFVKFLFLWIFIHF